MIKRMLFCTVAAVMLFEPSHKLSCQTIQVAHEAARASASSRLCDVLASIKDGERRTVTLSGVFVVGYENASFYDPQEPTCVGANIQPDTWIEFAPGVKNNELDRLVKRRSGCTERTREPAVACGPLPIISTHCGACRGATLPGDGVECRHRG